MKLFFDSDYTEEPRLLGQYEDREQCFNKISEFLKQHNYKPPYYRSWKKDNVESIDVGSHYEFFRIVYDDEET